MTEMWGQELCPNFVIIILLTLSFLVFANLFSGMVKHPGLLCDHGEQLITQSNMAGTAPLPKSRSNILPRALIYAQGLAVIPY